VPLTGAVEVDMHNDTSRRRHSVLVRERPQEARQHSAEARVGRSAPSCFAHLVMVDPRLGELSGVVEPCGHRFIACPADMCLTKQVGVRSPRIDVVG
jgi:hypothetical protein